MEALESDRVTRIVLVRPAVEAGERLGFLPGDLQQKVDPYLRPLFDALHEMLGYDRTAKLVDRNVIEVAPLAYMRGRTLNESFIILDEAQNTSVAQMKMFLTRIGFGSTAVVTGDVTQIDLPNGQRSGLRHAVEVLRVGEGDYVDVVRLQGRRASSDGVADPRRLRGGRRRRTAANELRCRGAARVYGVRGPATGGSSCGGPRPRSRDDRRARG